jgi:tetratricopeptide (TPR) repeat protein
MHISHSEIRFRKGLAALAKKDYEEAASHFRQAILLVIRSSSSRAHMQNVSYYGLALAHGKGPTSEAIQACERAVRLDPTDPVLRLNLGKAYALCGRTTKALAAFERGAAIAPKNAALRAEISKYDRRRPPVLSFLPRTNPLNRWLGRLRSGLFPAPALDPADRSR